MCVGKVSVTDYNGKFNNFLHGFEVKTQFRGRGYGTLMLMFMISEYNVDTLYVEAKNKIAVHLYRKFGFIVTDSFMKNGNKVNVMTRKLKNLK